MKVLQGLFVPDRVFSLRSCGQSNGAGNRIPSTFSNLVLTLWNGLIREYQLPIDHLPMGDYSLIKFAASVIFEK